VGGRALTGLVLTSPKSPERWVMDQTTVAAASKSPRGCSDAERQRPTFAAQLLKTYTYAITNVHVNILQSFNKTRNTLNKADFIPVPHYDELNITLY